MDEQTEELLGAIQGDETEKVRSLLEKGADPNRRLGEENDSAYPIHLAAGEGTRETVQALLGGGTDPFVEDEYGRTPLHRAVEEEISEEDPTGAKVKLLLDEGLDPDAQQTESKGLEGGEGDTPLHKAAAQGTRETVQALLDGDADPFAQDGYGRTPLHRAAAAEADEQDSTGAKVKLLLSEGLDPNAQQTDGMFLGGGEGDTPLHKAVQSRGDSAKETAKLLVEHGADLDLRNEHGATPLHFSSGRQTAELLLDNGADLNAEDSEGRTPLHRVAEDTSIEEAGALISLFLERGADPNRQLGEDNESINLIHLAAAEGTKEAVQALLDGGADPEVRDEYGRTPLHKAAEAEANEQDLTGAKVKLLLSEGLDPNARQTESQDEFGGGKGDTPLHKANGGFGGLVREVAEPLLEHGANPDIRKEDGETLLHSASERQTAEILLEHGANPNVRNEDGETPLYSASRNGYVEVVSALMEGGADPSLGCSGSGLATEGNTPLHAAAERGNVEVVRALLEAGADPDLKNADGETPLHSVPEREVFELLLGHGADPNARNEKGETLLHLASEETSFDDADAEMVNALLEKGADPNLSRSEDIIAGGGETPLHAAVGSGNVEIVRALLEAGADPSMEDEDGKAPLHSASESQVAEVLLENGADPSARDSGGRTPLHDMVQIESGKEAKALASLLLERGADPDAQNDDGFTPLHRVAQNRSNEEAEALASLLLEQGADPTSCSGIAPSPVECAEHMGNESVAEVLESAAAADEEDAEDSQLDASLLNEARDGNLEAVEDLLGRGADPDAMFEAQTEGAGSGMSGTVTALLFASWGGHADVVEALLEAGATPDRGAMDGRTPIAGAASYGHTDIVEALLDAGADPNAPHEEKVPPLGSALDGEVPEIAEMLLDAGADPDCRFSDSGFALLSYTAVEEMPQMTELFLAAGADPDLVDDDGYTALAYAALSGATEVARKLLDAGADPAICPGDRSLPELARDEGNPDVADLLAESS